MNRLLATLRVTLLVSVVIGVLAPYAAVGQSIPIKTVPVAEGSQFLLFPSRNLAMGSVGIALEDPLHDPVVNPARGIRMEGFRFTSAPVYYGYLSTTRQIDDSSGRTLPVGMFLRQDDLFVGASLVWQELVTQEASSSPQDNLYGFGMVGLRLPGTRLSLGASVLYADLHGLEGVSLLYSGSSDVRQNGSMGLYRLGLFHDWEDGREAEMVVLHHRFDMTHQRSGWANRDWVETPVTLTEYDETRGWAVRAGYRHPVSPALHVGVQVTGDWKHHPKIPNYDLMQIPRDPGNSSAYNVGVGFAQQVCAATFGVDLAFEPIRSHTWADALVDTVSAVQHRPIGAGEMTVENFFSFRNAHLRMGLHREGERGDFLVGLKLYSVRYHLDQENFLADVRRDLNERWVEWTFSLGFGFRWPEFQVRYLGLVTFGTGLPGLAGWGGLREAGAQNFSGDFIIAPAGDVIVREAAVFTHQLSILVPLSE